MEAQRMETLPASKQMTISPPALTGTAWRQASEGGIAAALFLCAAVSILTTVGIIGVLLFETIEFLREVPIPDFLFGLKWAPLFAPPSFGVLPLVAGTAIVSLIAMFISLPIGLLAAIYLSEYA